jgi:cytochrome P450
MLSPTSTTNPGSASTSAPEIEALRILGGDGLFTAYNDEPNWHKAHKLLMPAFTRSAMRRYHSIMLDVADELTAQ